MSQSKPSLFKRLLAAIAVVLLFGAALAGILWLWLPRQEPKPRQSQAPQPEHSRQDYSKESVMRDQCRKLISALRDFRSRRGSLPLPEGVVADEKKPMPINRSIYLALTGEDAALNPSQVNYLKPWGLAPTTLEDIQKERFRVCFDVDGDSKVPDPEHPDAFIEQDVIVWHVGEGGDPDTWGDNVRGWTAQ